MFLFTLLLPLYSPYRKVPSLEIVEGVDDFLVGLRELTIYYENESTNPIFSILSSNRLEAVTLAWS